MEAALTLMRRISYSDRFIWLRISAGFLLVAMLSLPPIRTFLEASLIHHMLVQIPLLALAGWMVGNTVHDSRYQQWNQKGIPGLLIALFGILFWMIPRWLDAALSEPFWEVAKFITVPLLIGLPLGASWFKISSFTRAIVWTNAISMLVVIGWLYVAAPIRVCNNYLVNQQEEFGYTAMLLALAIALYWIGRVFFGSWEEPEKH